VLSVVAAPGCVPPTGHEGSRVPHAQRHLGPAVFGSCSDEKLPHVCGPIAHCDVDWPFPGD